MKKTVILIILAGCFVSCFSQGFMQASFNPDVFSIDDYSSRKSSYKGFEFQIGNFVNEGFAQSLTVGFSTGLKYTDDLGSFILPSGNEIRAERLYSFSMFSLGYERKIIWIGEFDDLWNIYTTRRFALTFVKSKMEYNDPAVAANNQNDQYSKTGIGVNAAVGIGFARKFNKSTYAFTDLSTGVNYSGLLVHIPVTLSFGVRRLF